MMRKTYIASLAVCMTGLPFTASAQMVITDSMYDPPGSDAGKEWIKIYNNGDAPVDMTTWRIDDGSRHKLNAPPKKGGVGSLIIAPHATAIIASDAAQFVADHPHEYETVIDTALSLPNHGGTVALIDATGAVEYSMTYSKPAKENKVTASKPKKKTRTQSKDAPAHGRAVVEDASQEAAVGATGADVAWGIWLIPVVLVGIIGAIVARRFAREEWDIEEIPTDR